jgi:UDP-glucuronate decarboxylase
MNKRAIFDRKNILVIGGAGFIGSHLCDELVKKNKVICLDNFISSDERNIDHLLSDPNFVFINHDISQPIDLERQPDLQKFKIQFQGIQEIYNLACPSSPKDFNKNIEANLLVNSYGIKNIVDIAEKYSSKILHFSSSVIYGPRREGNLKISEDDYGNVDLSSERSSYDEGKRFAETMLFNYKSYKKIDIKIIRLFRIYGPRMQFDQGHMIPDFILNALSGKDLEIFGDENFSSSFCYVSDVVDAATKLMESDKSGPYNIGSDVDVKLSDLVSKIKSLTASNSKIVYKEKQLFITPLCLPDITYARNDLGWLPIVILDKGIKLTIDDIKANKDLKNVQSFN